MTAPAAARSELSDARPYRLVFDPQGEVLDNSLDCEAEVFLARFGNTREQLAEEYGPYAAQSVFVSLVTGASDVVATARLIAPGPLGPKTIADCARAPWSLDPTAVVEAAGLDLASTWDVATVSARPEARGSVLASAALYHGLIQVARANGVTATVAVLDERVRALLATVGLFYRPLPGTWPGEYLGSPASSPTHMHLSSMLDEQRRKTPDGYRLVTLGIGLDGVSVPSMEAFVLRRDVVDLRPSVEVSAAAPA